MVTENTTSEQEKPVITSVPSIVTPKPVPVVKPKEVISTPKPKETQSLDSAREAYKAERAQQEIASKGDVTNDVNAKQKAMEGK